MTDIRFDVTTKEALTGEHTGNIHGTQVVLKEVVVGDGFGYAGPAGMPNVIKDVLTGDHVGSLIDLPVSLKEVAAGDRVGQNLKPAFVWTTKEIIGRDSSYKFLTTTKESLVQTGPDEIAG